MTPYKHQTSRERKNETMENVEHISRQMTVFSLLRDFCGDANDISCCSIRQGNTLSVLQRALNSYDRLENRLLVKFLQPIPTHR
mmetsp:Transcript_21485/g.53286  ORF Transcript_21485/g.53286 Transcript_21485/m.53286 type:complete len:84 (+) Transcript_21485:1076-1327(+)